MHLQPQATSAWLIAATPERKLPMHISLMQVNKVHLLPGVPHLQRQLMRQFCINCHMSRMFGMAVAMVYPVGGRNSQAVL